MAHRGAALGPLVWAHVAPRVGVRHQPEPARAVSTAEARGAAAARGPAGAAHRPHALDGDRHADLHWGRAAVLRGLLVPAQDGPAGDDAALPLHYLSRRQH